MSRWVGADQMNHPIFLFFKNVNKQDTLILEMQKLKPVKNRFTDKCWFLRKTKLRSIKNVGQRVIQYTDFENSKIKTDKKPENNYIFGFWKLEMVSNFLKFLAKISLPKLR